MANTASPRDVFERLASGISTTDRASLAELYAEDTVVEHPFASPVPTRLEGREAVRAHFTRGAGVGLEIRVVNIVVHETADPEVIVAEYESEGLVTATGRAFRVPNVLVLRVRDGLIVSSRDYHDHLALAEAFGRLPELVAARADRP